MRAVFIFLVCCAIATALVIKLNSVMPGAGTVSLLLIFILGQKKTTA